MQKSGRQNESETKTEMKVRRRIHSDINNDDESREVEQRRTKLGAFSLFFSPFFFFVGSCSTYVDTDTVCTLWPHTRGEMREVTVGER